MEQKMSLFDQKLFSFLEKSVLKSLVLLTAVLLTMSLSAQNTRKIQGKVVDEQDNSVIGATIVVKDAPTIGTVTDIDGNFSLSIPVDKHVIVVSYVGMETQEINVSNKNEVTIVLKESAIQLEEMVVVGYGQQKKESVVGAITQTSGKVLERAGGVTNLGMALTGNLPGVITSVTTGMPGSEDPQIIVRTISSWNNRSPLILVDGVERPMSTIDIASVESISVLKDASATAVYGVKGANGVILITTKRGTEGKANIQIRANTTAKVISKLPEKYDSYDALMLKNLTIERELPLAPGGWSSYKPQQIINKYRYPANDEEWDRYPNVDWQKALFRNQAMSYNLSANVSGGVKFVKYFTAVDFVYEGDLFRRYDNHRGYESGYGYNRINVRSNLDFDLTKTTKFSTNLFGSNGVQTLPWGSSSSDASYWASAYRSSPDAMRPIYSNGMWGWYAPRNADVPNSVYYLATSGIEKRTTTQITTDFSVNQQLDMITKGLQLKANLSMDNTFRENQRGINDLYNNAQRMWVNPETGDIVYEQQVNSGTQLDHFDQISWATQGGSVDMGATYRKLYYLLQLNYARTFGLHDVAAMGLFSREKWATGSEFNHYREDWAFRVTYNYAMKYFTEFNGAYNGSEKFGPNHRFAFFPSLSGGWMVSEERFLKSVDFLDMLKLRVSWGKIGDDNVGGRWLYRDQWAYGGNTMMGSPPSNTPYAYYRITSLGNPNVSWETVEKRNFGVDYSFLSGLIAGSVDIFNDKRSDILISGNERAIPSYFGVSAPVANLGRVSSHGYELELNLNHTLNNTIRLWVNSSMTHAVNKIDFRDDPQLLPAYQKREGYPMGQARAYLDYGFIQTWDDLYGSTERATNNGNKLVGDYNIVDFNGDGIIDTYDQAPYKYADTPQNTFNVSLGFDWKGFSCFVQFYGVSNVTREVSFPTFHSTSNVAYVEGTYYTKDKGGDIPLPRWTTTVGPDAVGTRYLYDGSYVRLKNAEIAYSFKSDWVKKMGMRSCKFYLNGNNLFLWTKMPDDRESNFGGNSSFGAYPTSKRFNLGIDITF